MTVPLPLLGGGGVTTLGWRFPGGGAGVAPGGSIRPGARAVHMRCRDCGCCVDRFGQFRGYVPLPLLLPKTVPDAADGTWAV